MWKVCRGLLLAVCCMVAAFAEDAPFQEGVHYQVFPIKVRQSSHVDALASKDPGRIQIVEFFSYACHWCYQIDPQVTAWAQTKKGLAFRRVPVVFRPTWRPLAKAYWMAETLKITDEVHLRLFEYVQSGGDLSTDDAVRKFFIEKAHVSGEDFDAHYQSFSLNQMLEHTNHWMRAYQIMAVPTFVVNGPHRAYSTSIVKAGGEAQLFAVLDFLIGKELAAAKVE